MLLPVVVLALAAIAVIVRDACMPPAVIMLIVTAFRLSVGYAGALLPVIVLALSAIVMIVGNAGALLPVIMLAVAAVMIAALALMRLAIEARATRAITFVTDAGIAVAAGMRSRRAPTVRGFATFFAPIVALAFVAGGPRGHAGAGNIVPACIRRAGCFGRYAPRAGLIGHRAKWAARSIVHPAFRIAALRPWHAAAIIFAVVDRAVWAASAVIADPRLVIAAWLRVLATAALVIPPRAEWARARAIEAAWASVCAAWDRYGRDER